MRLNRGRVPAEAEIRDEEGELVGHRSVHVVLFNGWSTAKAGASPWPASGGRPATNWRVSDPPHAFEIKLWELA